MPFFLSLRMAKKKEKGETEEKDRKVTEAAAAAAEARRARAVVVEVVRDGQSLERTEEFLYEQEFLAETADIDTESRFT